MGGIRAKTLLYAFISIILAFVTTASVTVGIFFFRNALGNIGTGTSIPQSGETLVQRENGKFSPENFMPESRSERFNENARIRLREDKRITWAFVAIVAVIFLFFFTVYFLLLSKKMMDSLGELSKGIGEISSGNFDVAFTIRSDDELSYMAEGLNRTIVELKKIIAKERDEENGRKEFITSIAHDLRTPLTSVIGYLQLVMAGTESGDENPESKRRNDYARIAYDKAMRLQRLIEDLFSYTKTDSAEMILHLDEIDMVKLMEQLIDECYPSIQDADLQVEFSKTSEAMPVVLDGELMARAIANLLTNAIKYGKDGKKLVVELERENPRSDLKIRIINYGRIIPKEDISHIFDKFYRVDESRSSETGGTGLGLAIAKNIVDLHKGKITVKSDMSGTVFEITLPKEKSENIADEHGKK